MSEHIDDLLNRKVTDPIANVVAAAMDSGFSERKVREAIRIGIDHGVYEHRHPEERSPGDDEPRYKREFLRAERG